MLIGRSSLQTTYVVFCFVWESWWSRVRTYSCTVTLFYGVFLPTDRVKGNSTLKSGFCFCISISLYVSLISCWGLCAPMKWFRMVKRKNSERRHKQSVTISSCGSNIYYNSSSRERCCTTKSFFEIHGEVGWRWVPGTHVTATNCISTFYSHKFFSLTHISALIVWSNIVIILIRGF